MFDPAAWAESGHAVKVEVTLKQHLRSPLITRQQADLSWRRRSGDLREVSCQLHVHVHPSVERDPQPKPSAKVSKCAWVGGAVITPLQVLVGGANLHASVESNHHRHISLLNISSGTVDPGKMTLLTK